MSASINGTTGVTYPDGSTQATAATSGLVNKIINGRMEIDQRNAGASVTPSGTDSSQYCLDRFYLRYSVGSKLSIQQKDALNSGASNYEIGSAPVGFRNSTKITSLSAYTVGTNEFFDYYQPIEGTNVSDLGYGTSNAQTVTVSFWVKASLNGTYGLTLGNLNATRSYVASYTINSANTWEYKTVTVPGDTAGTWPTDNSVGLYVGFGLAAGSGVTAAASSSWYNAFYRSVNGQTSVVGTNGATFYITGVDLRKGTVAPTTYNMDWRPYGLELALCQRYFCFQGGESDYAFFANGVGRANSATRSSQCFNFPVTMRAAPSISSVSITSTAVGPSAVTAISIDQATTKNISLYVDVASGLTTGQAVNWYANGTQVPRVQYSAEL